MERHQEWRRYAAGCAAGLIALAALGTGYGLAAARAPRVSPERGTRFSLCPWGGGSDCVVDGDTFWMAGEKIRVADIDAPETHPPRCAYEARLGDAATLRLQQLLNAGPIELAMIDRDRDRYGRELRIAERGGRSLGGILVSEGLARPWEGHRRPWC
jgi:micrococcal nuclease